MKNLILILCLFFFGTTAMYAQTYKYIGAKKCKMCHNKPEKGEQFKKWATAKHSKAFNTIKEKNADDPKCLKCHSTAGTLDKKLIAGITKEEGVSCEACHGPGSVYKSMSIMKSQEKSLKSGLIMPVKEVCVKCHVGNDHTGKFDFDAAVKKVAHKKP